MMSPLENAFRNVVSLFGLPTEKSSAPQEQRSDYYDAAFSRIDEYKVRYSQSGYYFLWCVIVDRIRRGGFNCLLEVGCGPGQLAHFLFEQGIRNYVGFDFSPTAIKMASCGRPELTFLVADARSGEPYSLKPFDALVCTEVLEHIQDDLDVVDRFPAGCYCICTVPSFPYESHVRHFSSSDSVVDRYGGRFRDFSVLTLEKPGSNDVYYLFDGYKVPTPE